MFSFNTKNDGPWTVKVVTKYPSKRAKNVSSTAKTCPVISKDDTAATTGPSPGPSGISGLITTQSTSQNSAYETKLKHTSLASARASSPPYPRTSPSAASSSSPPSILNWLEETEHLLPAMHLSEILPSGPEEKDLEDQPPTCSTETSKKKRYLDRYRKQYTKYVTGSKTEYSCKERTDALRCQERQLRDRFQLGFWKIPIPQPYVQRVLQLSHAIFDSDEAKANNIFNVGVLKLNEENIAEFRVYVNSVETETKTYAGLKHFNCQTKSLSKLNAKNKFKISLCLSFDGRLLQTVESKNETDTPKN